MPTLSAAAIQLAGLRSEGATPAQRRAWLAEQGDAALAALLLAHLQGLRQHASATMQWAALADLVRAPHPEVLASPFGLRAVAIAANEGACLVHHERRVCLQWPDSFAPDDAVAETEHGEWIRGVLYTSKYQGFLQDDPLSCFNPLHMAKWTPHELLHRAASFFWRADATRWEYYLAARLNELGPVVLWYGLDEIGRRTSRGFDRAAWTASPAATYDDATWLTASDDDLAVLASNGVALLRSSLAHFDRELAAIDQEIATGRRVRVPDAVLDASSDATAYVVGHASRLADRAVSRCFDRLLRPGVDYFCDIFQYRDMVEDLFDRLLFDTIDLDIQRAVCRRDARVVRDWFQRAAHLGWNDFRAVVPLLPDAARELERAYHGQAISPVSWHARLSRVLQPAHAAGVLHNGAIVDERLGLPPTDDAVPADELQLLQGLRSVIPRSVDLALQQEPGIVARFMASNDLWQRAPLARRFAAFVGANDDHSLVPAMVDIELAIAQADLRIDEELEVLALDGELFDVQAGVVMLRFSTAFEFVSLNADAFALHALLEAPFELPPVVFLVGGYRGGVSLLPLWRAQHEALCALREEALSSDDFCDLLERLMAAHDDAPSDLAQDSAEWLYELAAAGAIACTPYLGRPTAE